MIERVLLVAWKGSAATAWVETLKSGGYTVLLEDTTGERAWRTAKERGIDVVIIDGQKKPSHGRQTGHALRDTAKTRNIPIIWTNLEEEDKASVQAEVKPDVSLDAPTDASSALSALQALHAQHLAEDPPPEESLDADTVVLAQPSVSVSTVTLDSSNVEVVTVVESLEAATIEELPVTGDSTTVVVETEITLVETVSTEAEPEQPTTIRPPRKPASKRPATARKTATRKSTATKSAAKKPAARKPAAKRPTPKAGKKATKTATAARSATKKSAARTAKKPAKRK